MLESTPRHPFLEGLSRHRGAPSTVIVIFGASGDLNARKLTPALYNLALDNLLPPRWQLIGFGRKDIPEDDFRQESRENLEQFSRRPLRDDIWDNFAPHITYLKGAYDDPEAFKRLKEHCERFEKDAGTEVQFLFYISTPPSVFEPIIDNLGQCGLANHRGGTDLASKVVIEKPFGHDLESARALNQTLVRNFHENQVYRIDHYLGKETVQDLLVLRFANSMFEPLWNRNYVDSVQITVAESGGVGSRAGYYDSSGATRDMLQNHTMQLMALIGMEPPVSLQAEDIRNEKVKLLKAIQPLKLDPREGDAVRAQYDEGLVNGERVKGYMEENGVAKESATETFAALKLNVENWRWHGVPFYLRSGKRLARKVSEVAIQFKPASGSLFSDSKRFDLACNTLVVQIQPDEGATLLLNSKVPGLETRTQPVKMHFRYATTFGSNTPEAYERLILDALVGDSTLFIRGDETETSWSLYTPLLEFWQECGRKGLESYAAGSWGPLAAERLLWTNGDQWRRPGP
ncbi:MAG: glucose-6-phosphate dehydrogenase [Opitutales bacterium]